MIVENGCKPNLLLGTNGQRRQKPVFLWPTPFFRRRVQAKCQSNALRGNYFCQNKDPNLQSFNALSRVIVLLSKGSWEAILPCYGQIEFCDWK